MNMIDKDSIVVQASSSALFTCASVRRTRQSGKAWALRFRLAQNFHSAGCEIV